MMEQKKGVPTNMELTFLGRGAAFYPAQGNTAACLREGGRLLLLDCGESVFGELMKRGLLNGVSEVTVVLSHFHSDHCGSLGSLCHYCRYALRAALRLIVPDDAAYLEALSALLWLYGVPKEGFSLIPSGGALGFSAFERLEMVPTRHAEGMPCYSIVLETAAGGVFYSADTCTEEPLLEFMRTHPAFERAYVDVTAAESAAAVHLPLRRLAEVIPPSLRSRVNIMHISDDACIAQASALGFGCVTAS